MLSVDEQKQLGYLLECVKLTHYDEYYDIGTDKHEVDLKICKMVTDLQRELNKQLLKKYQDVPGNKLPFALSDVYFNRNSEVREAMKSKKD